MKKFVLIFLGVPLLGVVCFFLYFSASVSVGPLNYLLNFGHLDTVIEAAQTAPLKPGESMRAELEDHRLVPHEFGRIFVTKTTINTLLLHVDRGGGHLGNQGYLYSEDPDINAAKAYGYSGLEGYETSRITNHWWAYDSTED